ncbi:MAG: monovalent cation/H+ antiporter subunit D [Burkholderiaceae bacterium]|nr:monovalent cation/H+ antiporter subunit D [Burkholderiaceae bacterium]
MRWADHLILVPVVLPLLAGASMLLFDERRRGLKFTISLVSTGGLLLAALMLMRLADGRAAGWSGSIGVYLAANWPVPFGIALAADRLSALMLMLCALLALASLVFSHARWNRAGVHFHALFQFLLMGVNGSFLTADLFNLFVFFEVMLAASYGLALHGSGAARVVAGMHYIAVNLVASSLFLIGVSMLYAVTGTLNMADLALIVPRVAPGDRMLLEAGAAILAVAFLAKSAAWPLAFWLPATYAAASAPAAAVFAILTKVGIYVILRLWLLLFAADAGDSTGFGRAWLLYGGMATLAFATIGTLASQDLRRLAAYSIIMSSGPLLAAIGFADAAVLAGALYYLVSATLAAGALFLLIELVDRSRTAVSSVLAVTVEAFEAQGALHAEAGAEESEHDDAGVIIPAAMAFLGLSFVSCALLVSGLPPLSGFIAKFALLAAMLPAGARQAAAGAGLETASWLMLALLIVSGLAAAIALMRIGIRNFWVPVQQQPPRLRVIEAAPVAALILLCLAITLQAGPLMRYLDATAGALTRHGEFAAAVTTAQPLPAPGVLPGMQVPPTTGALPR